MLKVIFKLIIATPLMIIMAVIVVMNANVNHTPEIMISGGDTVDHELVKELRGLKKALDVDGKKPEIL